MELKFRESTAVRSSPSFRKLLIYVSLVARSKKSAESLLREAFEEILRKHKTVVYQAGIELYFLGIIPGDTELSKIPEEVYKELEKSCLQSDSD